MEDIEYGAITEDSYYGRKIIDLYNECLKMLRQETDDARRDIVKMDTFVEMLFIGVKGIKSETYSYENEKRIYIMDDTLKYRLNCQGHIIPYCEVAIPLQDIAGITVGPTFDKANEEPLKRMLLDNKINGKMCFSKIIYRIF